MDKKISVSIMCVDFFILEECIKTLEEQGIDLTPLASEADRLAAQGQTPMFFAKDGKLLGLISVADPVKDWYEPYRK